MTGARALYGGSTLPPGLYPYRANKTTTAARKGATMKNTDVIKGTQTIAQYKIMQFVNQNFQPEALEIELIDGQTVKGTDRTGASMIFRWNEEKKTVETEG